MRSGTSFFDFTVFRKTLTRFWPIWAANLVFWLLCMPLSALMRLREDLLHDTNRLESFARHIGDNAGELGVILAVCFGLLAAMAAFSHLYSPRSANFMAALPVRREGQFVSRYLAGLAMLLVPNVVIFFLTLLVEVAGGAVWLFPLGYWLGAVCAAEFFFYSFAVFLAQFSGHILALPVYYGVFNCFVIALYALLGMIMDNFYYGFTRFAGIWEEIAYFFTPVVPFAQMDCDILTENGVLVQRVDGWQAAVIYPVVAAVLTACALLLYRRRHMESAGDIVAVAALRPLFKYGVAVCAGFAFGLLVTAMLGLGEVGMMVAIILWGIAGYFVAQMLLDKSVRVLKKWKGAAAVTAGFLVLFAVIAFDLTGFETRIPAADEVASVEIMGLPGGVYDSANWVDEEVTDPAVVQKIINLHAAAVEHRDNYYTDDTEWWDFEVVYHLKNGGSFAREYYVADSPANAAVPGTVWHAVEQLMSDREFIYTAYGFDEVKSVERSGGRLTEVSFNIYSYDKYSELEHAVYTGQDAYRLLAAVEADYAAGNIGRRTARRSDEDMLGSLCFQWEVPSNVVRTGYTPTPTSMGYDYTAEMVEYTVSSTHYIEIMVDAQSVNTIAAMEALAKN